LRRIIPACASPNAGVWSITKVDAIIIKAVSPSFINSHSGGQLVVMLAIF
jgi:hypothetical protein